MLLLLSNNYCLNIFNFWNSIRSNLHVVSPGLFKPLANAHRLDKLIAAFLIFIFCSHPGGLVSSLHERRTSHASLSPYERKKRKRDQYQANKRLARDLASVNITAGNESGNSVPGPSRKRLRPNNVPGGPSASAAQPVRGSSSSGHRAAYSETGNLVGTLAGQTC